jgi:hypothetical protein
MYKWDEIEHPADKEAVEIKDVAYLKKKFLYMI